MDYRHLTLKYSIKLPVNEICKKSRDLSKEIKIALDKATREIIAEEKAQNGYLVISDKKGGVIKVAAKDL